jgi:ABC-2 type transport system ATP-binding protein
LEIIAANNIVNKHSTGHGIQGISLSVQEGQCFGVIGANGSGKTTLTRLVAGLDPIQQGQLWVLEHSSLPRPSALRRRCGIALDTPAHWDNLSGRQNLTFFAHQYGLSGRALKQRVDELLEQANLAGQADDPVSMYSFGMCRKLTIVEAVVHSPDLLILDEPSAGLDTAFLDRLAEWIRQRCETGQTTWIADNNADWLGKTATDVALLSEGKIKAFGAVDELMRSIAAQYQITIDLKKPGMFDTPHPVGIMNLHYDEKQLTADVDGDPHLPAKLLGWVINSGGQVRSMEVHSITLHQALQHRIKKTERVR